MQIHAEPDKLKWL